MHDHAKGCEQDADIPKNRPVAQIFKIVPQAFGQVAMGFGRASEPPDLSQSGNAGFGRMTQPIARIDFPEQVIAGLRTKSMRPWPHQRHVATQHVKKLRQFVDGRSPNDPSDARDPLVVARCRFAAGSVGQIVPHAAELVDIE